MIGVFPFAWALRALRKMMCRQKVAELASCTVLREDLSPWIATAKYFWERGFVALFLAFDQCPSFLERNVAFQVRIAEGYFGVSCDAVERSSAQRFGYP